MWKVANGLFLLLLVVVVIEVLTFAPKTLDVSAPPTPPVATDNAEPTVEQKMKRVHLVETSGGEREWELQADEAITYRDSAQWKLDQVRVVFFKNNDQEYTVVGQRGQVEVETKNMIIEGQVQVTAVNGYRFTSDKMVYTSKRKELASPGSVSILGPTEPDGSRLRIAGDSLTGDIGKSVMRISGNVSATKRIDARRGFRIRSTEAFVSSRDLEAQFGGDVIVDMDPLRVTGRKATLKYSGKTQEIDQVLVEGQVKATDVDKFAESERMRAFLKEERYVMTGAPRLVQNNDELRGEEIVFLDGGKRIQVLRGRASVERRARGGG
jgi:LPS export ABC transporter protein LptC